MGEVLSFPEGREPKTRRDLPTPQDGIAEVTELQGAIVVPDVLTVEQAVDAADEIMMHLKDSFIAQAHIDSQYDSIKHLPLHDIIAILSASHGADWDLRSGYYIAVTRRLRELAASPDSE